MHPPADTVVRCASSYISCSFYLQFCETFHTTNIPQRSDQGRTRCQTSPATLESEVMRQEAFLLQQVDLELPTLAPSEWIEMCRLRCALRLGHALPSQPNGSPSQSPGDTSRRLLTLQSCLPNQQCGHHCFVRVSSDVLSLGCGLGNMRCGVFCAKWRASQALPSSTLSPLSAPFPLLVASFIRHFVCFT